MLLQQAQGISVLISALLSLWQAMFLLKLDDTKMTSAVSTSQRQHGLDASFLNQLDMTAWAAPDEKPGLHEGKLARSIPEVAG